MRCRCVKFFIVLLCFATGRAADSNTFLLQVGFGVAIPLSPTYLKDYWTHSISFTGGFGLPVRESTLVLFSYTNFPFDYKGDIVPQDYHAHVHEILVGAHRYLSIDQKNWRPYFSLAAGISLLRTPNLYRESRQYQERVQNDNVLEPEHIDDNPILRVGVGLDYQLSQENTTLFVEFYSATAFFRFSQFNALGGRCGVLFAI